MFGYINVNRENLSAADTEIYQSYYCGLCQELKKRYGRKGQMLLNYDMTFLIVLLTGLYELEDEQKDFICVLHPSRLRKMRRNASTSYAAAMNVLLSSRSFEDGWKDDRSYTKRAMFRMFQKDYEAIREQYPRQERAISRYLDRLGQAERQKVNNIDAVAGLTGEMLGEIFAWRADDVWAEELRCLGFYMGKFIYLMDAYEDMAKDEKRHSYNVLALFQQDAEQDFETFAKLMLTSMMAECAKSFERMPILLHAGICRNILYSGVWSKYEYLRLKKQSSGKRRRREPGNRHKGGAPHGKSL